ncbi:MAG: T9SS type A sorting domain-containing protein [Bacteroidales bacterium]|nr:T9SS type A sorting domain-containing protein [Bacteroidales bacterium]
MKYFKLIFIVISLMFLITNIKAQYNNIAEVLSSGGGETTGGIYSNFGVMGEAFVDFPVTGGNYITSIGFLFYASGIPILIDELNFNNQSISIFPNPTNEIINIEIKSQKIKLFNAEIYNIQGKLIFMKQYKSNSINIDISDLSKGIYLLKLKDENGSIIKTKKIVKE